MAEENATCVREIEVEIPAERVRKETKKVVRQISRVARVPGFRPGKAPAEIVRRRFWDDIKILFKTVLVVLRRKGAF